MTEYEDLTRRQLIDTIHGKQSRIDRLEQELDAIADAPTQFVIRELREEVQRQMNIAKQRAKRFDEVVKEAKDGDTEELCERLAEQTEENARIEDLRVQQQDYVIDVKRQNKELEEKLAELQVKLETERAKRKEIAMTLKDTREKLESSDKKTVTVFPTKDEVRASYKLNVSVRLLRSWAEAGVGPQPPYEELESWQAWVEAQSPGDFSYTTNDEELS